MTEQRQFISRPQGIRGCDYSHGGLYIEMFVLNGFMWTRGLKWKVTSVCFLTLKHILSGATMDHCFLALCMTFVLASFTRRSGAVGPVIKCEPCDIGARLLCKPLPKDCTEIVREPGCGCCMTCALSFGQPCGIYTGRCGTGLTCQYQPGEAKPLQALLEGRGICANATNKRLAARPTPPVNELPGNSRCAFSSCVLCALFTLRWLAALKSSVGIVQRFRTSVFHHVNQFEAIITDRFEYIIHSKRKWSRLKRKKELLPCYDLMLQLSNRKLLRRVL